MSATDRLAAERVFHDRQAAGRAPHLLDTEALRFSDDAWLDHETWIRPAFARLEDVADLPVLDYGCGHGMASVVLARQGARVAALDLSGQYLAEARRRAAANGVTIEFLQADAERLPFSDGSFARVWGNAVLHHLDVAIAARELHRILRPGGIAVFCEPWGENPFLSWARRRWSYYGKERTADEEPLRRHHLRALRQVFPSLRIEGHQLLSMVRRVLRAGRWRDRLDAWDARLLRLAPPLAHWCRYVVLSMRKESS